MRGNRVVQVAFVETILEMQAVYLMLRRELGKLLTLMGQEDKLPAGIGKK